VAALKGCSERYIQQLVSKSKLPYEKALNQKNLTQYLIPLTALDPKLQARYHGEKPKPIKPVAPKKSKPLDCYTIEERREIDFWIATVKAWQEFRFGEDKAAADEAFVSSIHEKYPSLECSADTLYRRWKAFRESDYDGLVDKRGKWRKGKSDINETIWQAFLSYYLDENQHPVKRCIEYTTLWAKQKYPELINSIPSEYSFYRRIKNDIPEPVAVLGREGEKAYRDRCAPYIRRTYDDMESNDYWIADNHTFDIITSGEGGERHRLYLTAFFDARSGIFTGFTITNNPCSDATIYALRKGILKYGIPRNIYVDNGREFLTFDVGGLGHRKRKSSADVFEPPGVFKRLDITMINALVRNARAKIIERRFRDVKDQLSRVFDTFCGGNVVERPEKLKKVLKSGNVPTDKELFNSVEMLLEYYFNEQPYGGAVAKDHGKTRMEVYRDNLITKRVASEEDLNLMLMRSSRLQKVGRRGVHLDIAGCRLDYWDEALINTYFGTQVYLRYDPEDLKQVRVYDEQDKYITTVQADDIAIQRYGANKDSVKAAMQKVRQVEKSNKAALQNSLLLPLDRITVLDLLMADAAGKKAALMQDDGAKVLEMQRVNEQPLLATVNGDMNIERMGNNAAKREYNREE
jgi:hypothetical protein